MPTTSSRRILVVDDNEDAAELLSSLMNAYGHETRVAHSGNVGLDLAATFHHEIVFLDIGMPEMSGYAVAERLRKIPKLDHICIAAVTGWDDVATKIQVKKAGFNFHIAKPASIDELLRVVECCWFANIEWVDPKI